MVILEREFNFLNHHIILEYLGSLAELKVKTKGKCRAIYTNTLSFPLTQAILRVEGQALTKLQTFDIGTIEPGKTITQEFEIEALEQQNHFLIATLLSKELTGVTGHIELLVLAP